MHCGIFGVFTFVYNNSLQCKLSQSVVCEKIMGSKAEVLPYWYGFQTGPVRY